MPDGTLSLPSLDGPYSPEETLRAAELVAEGIRYLNHATRHREALRYPADADRLLRHLETAAYRLPQLVGQVSAWVNDEYADGRIEMTGGEFPQSVLATMAVEARLDKAAEHAESLSAMLGSAASVTSHMAAPEDGDG